MAGASVIPRVGAFFTHTGALFHDQDFPRGFKLMKNRAQGGTHDASAN
jgi:hypothetical protein